MTDNSTSQTQVAGISNEIQYVINLVLNILATMLLSSFGFVSNCINLKVFYNLGVRERVNFTFFVLSFFDCLVCVFTLAASVDFVFLFCDVKLKLDQYPVYQIILVLRAFSVDYSALLLTFIALERCVCVAFPFVFSTRFNTRLTRTVMACIMSYLLLNYLPLLSSFEFKEIYIENTNETIITYIITDFFLINVKIQLYLLATGLAYFCQITIFVCAIVMYYGLRKSSMIRLSMQETSEARKDNSNFPKPGELPKKEKRIVRLVMTLACLYLPTALPQLSISIAFIVFPDLSYGSFENIFITCYGIVALCAIWNTSFSIIIYYKYNATYRNTFVNIFSTAKISELCH